MARKLDLLYPLGEAQKGAFTTAQAEEAGVSRRMLSHYATAGDVVRLKHGIYRLTRFPTSPFEDVAYALLWVGDEGAASHVTALMIHDLTEEMSPRVHVTLPRLFAGGDDLVVVHHAPLERSEVTRRRGLRVTNEERTVRDVAAANPWLAAEAMVEAVSKGMLSEQEVKSVIRLYPALEDLVTEVGKRR
jgi:predicted transcriptional regulator of viral defense system